jgi:molybdenum cofactor cytidylyltransferase
MRPTVHILILAAGASSRMRGLDKLMQPIAGVPILRRCAEAAVQTGMPVAVALPPIPDPRHETVSGLPVDVVEVPDRALGMSRSLVRGVQAISGAANANATGLMVLPADMPGLTRAGLTSLIGRFQAEPLLIWRGGTQDGRVGHPTIFPRALWPELLAVTGDEGGRSVLRAHADQIRVHVLPGQMAVLDLDTPEDWAAHLGRPL